jgi:DNA-binding transcriptional ArsR family regulator
VVIVTPVFVTVLSTSFGPTGIAPSPKALAGAEHEGECPDAELVDQLMLEQRLDEAGRSGSQACPRLRRRLVPERVDRDRNLLMDLGADERRVRLRRVHAIAKRLNLAGQEARGLAEAALLDQLFQRDGRTLTELESELQMTRFGVMKHLRVLEQAELVVSRRRGREKHHFLNPVPIRLIHDRWIDKYTEPHVSALAGLKTSLEKESA